MIAEGIAIREAGAEALPRVMAIMRTAFDPAFGEAWSELQCSNMLAGPGAWLMLGDLQGRAAGFAMTRAVVDEAELLLIAVDPLARGRRLGAALLEGVAGAARARGVRRLFLEVRAGNPATALYRGAGFVKVGERKGYYRGANGAMLDAHSYSRRIDA